MEGEENKEGVKFVSLQIKREQILKKWIVVISILFHYLQKLKLGRKVNTPLSSSFPSSPFILFLNQKHN